MANPEPIWLIIRLRGGTCEHLCTDTVDIAIEALKEAVCGQGLIILASERRCGLVGRHNLRMVRANSSRAARDASRAVMSGSLPPPL
jgi:hypothetical protein